MEVPMTTLMGYAADNAFNMMGSSSELKSILIKTNLSIFVLCCICHSLALCASSACAALPDDLEQLCHDIFFHFAHSAKRKHTFEKFQKLCSLKPNELLRPSQTRWLSLKVIIYLTLQFIK